MMEQSRAHSHRQSLQSIWFKCTLIEGRGAWPSTVVRVCSSLAQAAEFACKEGGSGAHTC